MKTLNTIFTLLIISVFLLQPVSSKADVVSGGKTTELSSQIIQEIKEVLKTPYLKFESKDLNGDVKVITAVSNDGKILFKDIKGLNEDLVDNVIDKLNSLNLWTSPDYSGKEFTYTIKYKN